MTMTLVEFLRTRLDDDERAAKRVRQPYRLYVDEDGRFSEPIRNNELYGEREGEYEQWPEGDDRMPNHIASWDLILDPVRVLREVEAKRQIIGLYERSLKIPASTVSGYVSGQDRGYSEGCLDALKMLALPYADHEDYHEEWKP